MARVINSVDEIEALPEGSKAWIEYRKPVKYDNTHEDWVPTEFDSPVVYETTKNHGDLECAGHYLVPSEMDAADYIRMFIRVWDAEPTETERKEQPWPTKEECEAYW